MKASPADARAGSNVLCRFAAHHVACQWLGVVSAFAFLLAFMGPMISAVRARSRAPSCPSALRLMAVGLKMYLDDHDGGFPSAAGWQSVAVQTSAGRSIHCPVIPPSALARLAEPTLVAVLGYAFNARLAGFPIHLPHLTPVPLRVDEVRFLAATVAFGDCKVELALRDGPDVADRWRGPGEEGGRRHHGGANYAFVDGHVAWYPPEVVDSARTRWKPDGSRPSFKPF
jgi:prepilin-type processing-associated H-X9-DG protein